MRITLAAVGRLKRGPAAELTRDYLARLPWPVAVKEVEERRPLAAAELRAREGERLLAAVPAGAAVVALDAGGEALASEAFARRLAAWQEAGSKDLAFVIGGAEGLDRAVIARADLVLSLGPMTWPHGLARAMLAEQLYRAHAILAGHPYHR